VLREEGEDVVASFLASHAEFTAAPFDSAAARAVAESPAAHTLRLLPHVHGTDGYFIASFARRE
jgi:16S rRNA (cytosine967-C5)-methyltransferase